MPVIINNSTGLAEELPLEQAQSALYSGSHSVPMINQQGQHVSIPYNQASDAVQQGMRQLNPVEIKNLQDYAHYSSPEQQLKTAAEGAASALTFGTSTGAEIGMGVDPEDIRMRRKINPGMHSIGEMGGLIGGTVTGTGEAALLGQAGEAAAALSGIKGATLASRAAITGIKQAAEMGLYQLGDETSKAFLNDPDQSIGSVVLDTGLSSIGAGVLGAGGHFALGGLWNATIGPKLEKLLTKAKSVQEDMPAILDIARKAEKAGIDLDPIMQGAMTPEGREAFRELSMSKNTKVGAEVNASLENLRNKAEESILNVFGKTPDNLEKSSNAELGDKLRSTISESIDPIAKRANEAYESLNKTDKVLELTPTAKASIIGNLEKFGLENTFKLSGTEESSC